MKASRLECGSVVESSGIPLAATELPRVCTSDPSGAPLYETNVEAIRLSGGHSTHLDSSVLVLVRGGILEENCPWSLKYLSREGYEPDST